MDRELEMRLRSMIERGEKAQTEWSIVGPRIEDLKGAIHATWEEATEEQTERDCKALVRVLTMLSKLWSREIGDLAIARHKMNEGSEND